MMFGGRLEIRLELKLLSDLHIGSGQASECQNLGKLEDGEYPKVSEVLRDSGGSPVLTSTALKGALRQAPGIASTELDDLFGKSGEDPGDSNIARLWIGMFRVDGKSKGRETELTASGGIVDHGFIKTGNAIDRRTGSVADKKLYNQEWIEAGVVFGGTLTLFWDGMEDAQRKTLTERVALLMAPLWRSEGLAIGADSRHGAGRVGFSAISCTEHGVDAETLALVSKSRGEVEKQICGIASGASSAAGHAGCAKLRLVCDGPFISMRAKVKVDEGGQEREVTEPLRRNGMPHLWPSSCLGALRSAASWFAELDRLRSVEAEGDKGTPCDDPDKAVMDKAELSGLTATERLFGVSGWRGLIRVERLEPVRSGETVSLKSVSIDRFTGGAMDQRLFTENVFENVTFELDLSLDPARSREDDVKIFKNFVERLTRGHILELGHGGSKGFGWFVVEAR